MNIITQDKLARQQALDITQSFIVRAPAGSGKTELLTQRYLKLLANCVNYPEEIIAITFTRKAAAEMRARILKALKNASLPKPEQAHAQLTWQLAKAALQRDRQQQWHLTDNPNRLRVVTIDSLAANLCQQVPVLAQFGAAPSITEDANTYYRQAIQRLLSECRFKPAWSDAVETLLLHLDNHAQQFENLIVQLLARREQWLPYILQAKQHQQQLKPLLEQALQHIGEELFNKALNLIDQDLWAELIPLLDYAAANLEQTRIQSIPSTTCNDIDVWKFIANGLLTKQGEWRKQVNKLTGFPLESPLANKKEAKLYKEQMSSLLSSLTDNDELCHLLADIQQCPPFTYTNQQWATVQALLTFLPIAAAQLQLIFQENNTIDFIELTLAASRALGNEDSPTDLALHLDYKIQHLLIDEFQDTSITHFNFLQKLISEWQNHDGRSIFLVGDPMQSIYRFRHAEVSLFLRTEQLGIGAIPLKPLTLHLNFRSQSPLVNWFNHTFSQVFPEHIDLQMGAVNYTSSEATHHSQLKAVHHYPLFDANRADEAKLITDTILQLQTKHPNDSIAILVRSRSQLHNIVTSLHQQQIPFHAVDIEPLSQRMEIQDCITVTRILLHFNDRTAWLALLRAPWCGLSLADLHAVANHDCDSTLYHSLLQYQHIPHLSDDAIQRLQRIVPIISQAIQQRGRLSLSQQTQGLWLALGGPATLAHTNQLQNCQRYFALLNDVEKANSAITADLINDALAKLYAKPLQDPSTTLQIMTIHKAKGLEFDHVILPGLCRRPAQDSAELLAWLERPNAYGDSDLLLAPIKASEHDHDPIYHYLRLIEKQKLQHELARLLYVASTRAKHTLHLYYQFEFSDDGDLLPPAKNSFADMLCAVCSSEILATPAIEVPSSDRETNIPTHMLQRLSNTWQPIILKATHPIISQANENVCNDTLHSNQTAITGTVIHEALQQLALGQQHTDWEHRLIQLGTPVHLLREQHALVNIAINNTLQDERGQWILQSHQQARNEYDLSMQNNNGITRAIIDRTFIANDTRWIIDYKTATPNDDQLDAFLAEQKATYQLQLDRYAAIFSQLDNHPIRLGLYFPLCKAWLEWAWETNAKNVTMARL